MPKKIRSISFYVLLALAFLIVVMLFTNEPEVEKHVFSELVTDIEAGKVTSIVLNDTTAEVTYKDGAEPVVVNIPSEDLLYEQAGDAIKEQTKTGTLTVEVEPPQTMPWWMSLLSPIVLLGLIVVAWIFIMRQSQGGGKISSFGKSKAAKVQEGDSKKTFEDVAGVDEEKAELQEIVDFLKAPEQFAQMGARIPKGVLLVGPPGTGKTLLAKAVAGEAGVPFYNISGSDFVEMFVGVGASRVRDLFDQAKKSQPCIVFIDEIDAVGRHRGAGLGGGHDEREQTLNQLLVEMDGFGENTSIIVMAATNRSDILDPALMRPGRFDRQIYVGRPDQKGRKEILAVHAKNKPLGEDVSLDKVSKITYGFTGADLENLLNEGALLATRKKKTVINMDDLDEALLKVVMGPEKKSRMVSQKDKEMTAYHEAGHAILSYLLPTQDPVHQVSIIPRGAAGGFTLNLPDKDKTYVSKEEMTEEIIVLMGGRVAEQVIFGGTVNTGASSDIQKATELATQMVKRYGMSEKLGNRTFGSDRSEVFVGMEYGHTPDYSQETAALIDSEVSRIIEEAYARCTVLMKENISMLTRVKDALMEKEKLDGDEFLEAVEATLPEAEDTEEAAQTDVAENGEKE